MSHVFKTILFMYNMKAKTIFLGDVKLSVDNLPLARFCVDYI